MQLSLIDILDDNDISFFVNDKPPVDKADIMISDQFGIFGDSNLAYEYFDHTSKYLKPDGFCIPSTSSSFVSPVMSTKLHNKCKQFYRPVVPREPFVSNFQTPFLVNPLNVYRIAKPKKLFDFTYNADIVAGGYTMFKTIQYEATTDAVIHGFLGHFEAVLYKEIVFNVAETFEHGQTNQFYFPLSEPICVTAGDLIEAHFWRCASPQHVWYEWSVTKPKATFVHNSSGNSFFIYK